MCVNLVCKISKYQYCCFVPLQAASKMYSHAKHSIFPIDL
ncbi:hypothetical protein V6Z11_D13G084900 [Gossypium hirsutum]